MSPIVRKAASAATRCPLVCVYYTPAVCWGGVFAL